MKLFKGHYFFRVGAVVMVALALRSAQAGPTIWTGPSLAYSQPSPDPTQAANQDRLTSRVWLTRGPIQGMFNAVDETAYDKGPDTDPTDTEWAYGTIDQYASLSYDTWANMSGHNPPSMVGQSAVLHLITDNIYLSITFTYWGGSSGGFAYNRSTPAVAGNPPTVNVTNPTNGSVFAAPANVKLAASASVSGGTVTNVQFFANAVSLGSVTNTPFNLTSGSLGAGSYSLTAVATAAGISSTSAPVTVSVVTPVAVTLSGAKITNGQFTFNYTANAGLDYVVQASTNFTGWVSLSTNVATGSPVSFAENLHSNTNRFYRVGRLPNP